MQNRLENNAEFEDDKDLVRKYVIWLVMLLATCGISTAIILAIAYYVDPVGMRL